jgi:hypothetical protein
MSKLMPFMLPAKQGQLKREISNPGTGPEKGQAGFSLKIRCFLRVQPIGFQPNLSGKRGASMGRAQGPEIRLQQLGYLAVGFRGLRLRVCQGAARLLPASQNLHFVS